MKTARKESGAEEFSGATQRPELLKYADILEIPRPALKHPRMSQEERAAQFAPFAALVGFARRVQEAGEEHLREVEMEVEVEVEAGLDEIEDLED